MMIFNLINKNRISENILYGKNNLIKKVIKNRELIKLKIWRKICVPCKILQFFKFF